MSYNYSNQDLNEMSRDEYQKLQNNPWRETNVDNLFLSKGIPRDKPLLATQIKASYIFIQRQIFASTAYKNMTHL